MVVQAMVYLEHLRLRAWPIHATVVHALTWPDCTCRSLLSPRQLTLQLRHPPLELQLPSVVSLWYLTVIGTRKDQAAAGIPLSMLSKGVP